MTADRRVWVNLVTAVEIAKRHRVRGFSVVLAVAGGVPISNVESWDGMMGQRSCHWCPDWEGAVIR
jgi:hypothetical protein